LLGVLNSSVGTFWAQQSMHNKGGPGGACSKDEKWHDFYEFGGTRLLDFPLPQNRPLGVTQALDSLARSLAELEPTAVLNSRRCTSAALDAAKKDWDSTRE
jgi:hypothetical protein